MAFDKPEQVSVTEIALERAPKIQAHLKRKFGYGENIFFYNDLVEYRLNNSRFKIAGDLAREYRNMSVEDAYNITSNTVRRESVDYAFRGYDESEFPDHQFDGLFGESTNDIIEELISDGKKDKLITSSSMYGIHDYLWKESGATGRATIEEVEELLERKLNINDFNPDAMTNFTKERMELKKLYHKHQYDVFMDRIGGELGQKVIALEHLVCRDRSFKIEGRSYNPNSECIPFPYFVGRRNAKELYRWQLHGDSVSPIHWGFQENAEDDKRITNYFEELIPGDFEIKEGKLLNSDKFLSEISISDEKLFTTWCNYSQNIEKLEKGHRTPYWNYHCYEGTDHLYCDQKIHRNTTVNEEKEKRAEEERLYKRFLITKEGTSEEDDSWNRYRSWKLKQWYLEFGVVGAHDIPDGKNEFHLSDEDFY